jgi:hypothetical protein
VPVEGVTTILLTHAKSPRYQADRSDSRFSGLFKTEAKDAKRLDRSKCAGRILR